MQIEFDPNNHKSIILIDKNLPSGLAVNAACVISVNLGRKISQLVGKDLLSKDEVLYPGVVCSPLPILVADNNLLNDLYHKVKLSQNIFALPFSSLAQSCRTYEEYTEKMSNTHSNDINIIGLGLVGQKKEINKLSGSFSLFK
jgi:hypothetical protein